MFTLSIPGHLHSQLYDDKSFLFIPIEITDEELETVHSGILIHRKPLLLSLRSG
jgi:hypothetical protein